VSEVSEAEATGLIEGDPEKRDDKEPSELDEDDIEAAGDIEYDADEDDVGGGGAESVAIGSPVTVTVMVDRIEALGEPDTEGVVDAEK